MFHDYEDGVIMDDTVMMIEEKQTSFPVTTRIFQFLVIALGSWGGISMLVECAGIPCNMLRVNSAILIFSALFYLLCLHPSFGLVKLFFSILIYGLFFYSRLPRILNGFYTIENLVLKRISIYYGTKDLKFVADYTTAEADTTLFMIMLLFLTIGLLAVAVVCNRFIGVITLLQLLPVTACFALGLIPSERYMIPNLLSILYLLKSGNNGDHDADRKQRKLWHMVSSRSAIWFSMLSLLLFFLMKLVITKDDYDSMTEIKEMKSEIQTAMNDFSIKDFSRKLSEIELFTRKVSSTGLNGGELGRTGQVQYENVRHLTIVAPIQSIEEGIYLKGYVGSVYTGDRWETHSQEMQKEYEKLLLRLPQKLFPPVNQTSIFLKHFIVDSEVPAQTSSGWYEYSLDRGSMKIEYRGANNKFIYAPYFTDYSEMRDIVYEQDLYASPAVRKNNYEYQYFYDVSLLEAPDLYEKLLDKLSDYTEYEKLYREYVHQAYTQLPAEGLVNVKRDFSPERVKTKTGSVTEKIAYIKKYLEQNTQYSLTPGRLPEGEDFVEYFLYTNKVGYCAHYASAATLMLRCLGIPARYVEGYAVGKESIYRNSGSQETTRYTNLGKKSTMVTQSEVNVMDYNAHAWVEVYFDNCGWVPVEFTPGSTVDYNNSVVADMEEFSSNIEDGNIKKSLENSDAIPSSAPNLPIAQQQEEQSSDNDKQDRTASAAKQAELLYLWVVFAVPILMIASLLLYRIHKNNQARFSDNLNRRAIFHFEEVEKMLRACQGLPDKRALLEESETYVKEHVAYVDREHLEEMMEITRKARFGGGMITELELKKVQSYRENLYTLITENSSICRRIYLKLILLI